jgi:hypothetical protein
VAQAGAAVRSLTSGAANTPATRGRLAGSNSSAAASILIDSPENRTSDEHPAKTPLASAAVRNLLREVVAFHIRGALTVWFEANLIRLHSFARCLRLRPKDLENCA